MLYLHSIGVIHRDLKAHNLLVTAAWRIKVADFNLSKQCGPGQAANTPTPEPQNPRWLAPEVMQSGVATAASDVFSFGTVLWELLTFCLPFSDGAWTPWEIQGMVCSGVRPPVPPREQLPGPDAQQFSQLDGYLALMHSCWQEDPAARPRFDSISRTLWLLLSRIESEEPG